MSTVRVSVRVLSDTVPLSGAMVQSGSLRQATGDNGIAVLALPPGAAVIRAMRIGFRPESLSVFVRAGTDTSVDIQLVAQAAFVAPVLVTSTRMERRIETEPLRIEVLGGEDVGEKSEMRPADSRTLLTEMSGVRVQSRSPLGATNVRLQGLPGRYTAVLSDGLPLYGGQASSFTLVDVVPLDLRQAEVIKGAASALYGPQALAGVVNLVSRRPPDSSQVLVNQSAPSSTDAMAFLSGSLRPSLGYSLLGGAHTQNTVDRDHDGWADAPGFRRAEIRPRLFFDDSAGHSIMVTAGGFAERRSAGFTPSSGGLLPGPTAAFVDSLSTAHGDAGAVGQWQLNGATSFALRASFSGESRRHRFGDAVERFTRNTALGELSATDVRGPNAVVAGIAMQDERYSSADLALLNRTYTTPGIFLQDTYSPLTWASATLNARCDRSNAYGTICTPRLSLLAQASSSLSARLSAGNGWFAPTPLTDETETFSLSRVRIPQPLAAERGSTASFDLTSTHGPLQVNGTLFTNRVTNAVGLHRVAGDTTGAVELLNATGPLAVHGAELFAVFNQEPFVTTAYYALTRSRETSTENGRVREVPFTPRESAGLDFALEEDESGSYGAVEVFYTGRQSLEDNPYATESKPFTTVGVLLSQRLGRASVFLNGENLTNVRVTNYHPLSRARAGEGGRWTVDPWAPLEGRRFNAGVRLNW